MLWGTGLSALFNGDLLLLLQGVIVIIILTAGTSFLTKVISVRQQINSGKLILVLTFLFGVGLFSYFTPGDIPGGDSHSHIARTWLFNDIIRNDPSLPIWTNRWYFGYPMELYYGFLYYSLSGFISLLLFNDVIVTTKLLLWVFHVSSGICMFLYIKLVTKSDMSAVISAIFYVFSFQHLGIILLSGALQLSLIFLFLPILFFVFELFYRSRIPFVTASIIIALVLSLIIFTHIQYGLFVIIAFLFVISIRFSLNFLFSRDISQLQYQAKFLVFLLFLFLLYSSWFIIPLLLEKQYLVLSSSDTIRELTGSFSIDNLKRASTIFLWSRVMRDWEYYYIGVVPLCVVLFASVSKWRHREAVYQSYFIAFLMGLIYLLSNSRFTNIWFFFTCVLSGYGVLELKRVFSSRSTWIQNYLFPLLMILILFDLGLTLIQSPYQVLNNSKIGALQEQLDSQRSIGRILVLTKDRSTLWRSLDVIGTNASSPFGGIPQSSIKTHPYVAAIASKAALETFDNNANISKLTYDALRLLDIKYVLIPEADTVLTVPYAYPVWFSQKLKKTEQQSTSLENETWESIRPKYEKRTLDYALTDYIVRQMQLDKRQPIANYIFLHDSYTDAEVTFLNSKHISVNQPSFTLKTVRETHSLFQMRYLSSVDGFIFLSYSYFPFNIVEIDGLTVPTYKSAGNFLVVPIPQGEHLLTLRPGVSLVRLVLLGIALSSFFVSVYILIKTTLFIRRVKIKAVEDIFQAGTFKIFKVK